jgi:putative transcriptional regulator
MAKEPDQMPREAFDQIMDGLTDALAYAEGDTSRGTAHVVDTPSLDVKAIRARLKLSQGDFAKAFRVPVGTLRHWEQGRRRPTGTALALLEIIDKEPDAVRRALSIG